MSVTELAKLSEENSLTPDQMAAFGGDMVAGIPEVLLKAISIAAVAG